MLHRIALASALALVLTIAACRQAPPGPPAGQEKTAGQQKTEEQPRIDQIAVVGHGMAFDAKMQEIPIDLKTILSMQGSLGERLAQARLADDDGTKAFAAKVEAAMAESKSEEERALLTGAVLNRQLQRADQKMRAAYDWRNRFLTERARGLLERRYRGQYQLSESVLQLLREGGLIVAGIFDTGYMNECRAESVPVPPDFSMAKPGQWIHQGGLTFNILRPGDPADVYTWTDPARRGACIALPRDNGGIDSVAGIICQSATTGKACIWDNLTRDDPSRRIPAATETMVIRELQDGRTLAEGAACTGCHTGNNIYLMSPDDSTWAKVLRGLDGPQPTPRTFTTVVEPQTDSPGGPRFTPIAHASWVNPPLTAGCGGACHAGPNTEVQTRYFAIPVGQRNAMQPTCATGGNYRNCYGTP